jgi:hypothetical protein
MKLVGVGDQHEQHFLFDSSGTITTGGTPQLLLPQHSSRSIFMFSNGSAETMYIDFGCGYAHCAITSGVVTSVTVDNAGFNFTYAPRIHFYGGGQPVVTLQSGRPAGLNTSYVSAPGPGFTNPSNRATAIATLNASTISLNKIAAITIRNGGSGYVVAPFVHIFPSDLDPNGVVIPGSANPGSFAVTSGGSLSFLASACPTDACSIVGATTGDKFTCKYMT